MRTVAYLPLLLACATADPDQPRLGCGFDHGLGLTDADDDGYGSTLDCDDADPEVHPEAQERCNGVDDDCDEETDEADAVDAAIWYPDLDGDGWGDALGKPVAGCAAPFGYGAAGDCNDQDPRVNPEALERCDFLDEDCDGLVDEEAIDALEGCPDNDLDTFGDPAGAVTACVLPFEYVPDCADCDDGDAGVHPHAQDVCNAVDDDCDGVVDPLDVDADGDGWTGCDGDCDDDDPAVHPEAAEICGNGADDDCDGWAGVCGLAGEAAAGAWPALLTGASAYDLAGGALAGLGDLTGDGLGEIAVGPDEGGGERVFVLRGDPGWPERGATALAEANHIVAADGALALAAAGDADGDGVPDLLVGAAPDPWLVSGAALVATAGEVEAFLVGWPLAASGESDELGAAVAGVGDADGDGVADLLLGAPGTADGAGAVWLLPGPVLGAVAVGEVATCWRGEGVEDRAGEAVAGAGDVDGDGLAELLVGAQRSDRGRDDAGVVYLLDAEAAGGSLWYATGALLGPAPQAFAGCAVAGAGDVTGDGLDDVLAGARGARTGGVAQGAAYLVAGPVTGEQDLAAAAVATLIGEEDYSYAGTAVAGPGDLDGDGVPEVAIGAPYLDAGLDGQGGAFVFAGPLAGLRPTSTAEARLWGGVEARSLGAALAGAGDVDGDGYGDLLVGLPGYSADLAFAGAAWLLFGGEGF